MRIIRCDFHTPRKQKNEPRDAWQVLRLLVKKRFPRVWIPSAVEQDPRQLMRHRHKLVRLRTTVRSSYTGWP